MCPPKKKSQIKRADTLLFFQLLLLLLLIRSLSLLMAFGADMDFYWLGFLDWLFNGYLFGYCGILSHRSNNLLWCNSLYFLWLVLFAKLQFVDMVGIKDE